MAMNIATIQQQASTHRRKLVVTCGLVAALALPCALAPAAMADESPRESTDGTVTGSASSSRDRSSSSDRDASSNRDEGGSNADESTDGDSSSDADEGANSAQDADADSDRDASTDSDASSSSDADATDDEEEPYYTKRQVVYVKTDAEGYQTGVYVVNSFEADDHVRVTDDGDYIRLVNLSDAQQLVEEDNAVKFDVSDNEIFRYEGELHQTTDIPWNISIEYTLNGEKIKMSELAGCSGKLETTITVSRNDDCDPVYAENYLLQIGGAFDDDIVSHIKAEGASIAQEGGNTQVNYMLVPGSDESTTYTITANVEDFEFDGWTIAGIPLAFDMDVASMLDSYEFEELDELEAAIADVNEGAQSVNDGAQGVNDAAGEVGSGIDELAGAGSELDSGASELSSSVSDSLVPGIESLAAGSQEFSQTLASNATDAQSSADAIDVAAAQQAYEDAPEAYVTAYVTAYASGLDPTTDQSVIDAQNALQSASSTLVSSQAQKSAYEATAQALSQTSTGYEQIDGGIQGMIDTEAEGNIYALRDGTSQLANSVDEYTNGVDELQANYGAMTDATQQLADGTEELAQGTQELRERTTNLSDQFTDGIAEEVEGYINPDFEAPDFVNGQTKGVAAVQFVIMTDKVEIPEDDADTAAGADKDLAGKFKALFETEE